MMKTHILLTLLSAFILTACASNEGRGIASSTKKQKQDYQTYESTVEGNAYREFGRD